jgi:phage terminase small subunit
MANKLTPKQEAWMLAYIKTGNGAEAYRTCYDANGMSDKAISVEVDRLKKNPRVALGLERYRKQVSERVLKEAVLDTNAILDELKEARDLALKLEQPNVMVSASMGRAKVAGLIIERSEQGKPGDFSAMSKDELREHIRREAEELGLSHRAVQDSGGRGKTRDQLN